MNYYNLDGILDIPRSESMAYAQNKKQIEDVDKKLLEHIDKENDFIQNEVQKLTENIENVSGNAKRELSETADTINSTVVNAIDTINASVDTKLDIMNDRVDNIIANNSETEGNSELIDIRTGADGEVYATAGTSVRSQVESIKNDVDNALVNSGFSGINKAEENLFSKLFRQRIWDQGVTLANGQISVPRGKRYWVLCDTSGQSVERYNIIIESTTDDFVIYLSKDETAAAATNIKVPVHRSGNYYSAIITASDIPSDHPFITIRFGRTDTTRDTLIKKCIVSDGIYYEKVPEHFRQGIYVSFSDYLFNFDTTGKTITLTDDSYLVYNEERYIIPAGTYSYDVGDAGQKLLVYDRAKAEVKVIQYTDYTQNMIVCFEFPSNVKMMQNPNAFSIRGKYLINNTEYPIENTKNSHIVYVSPSGDDTNTGEEDKPFRTFSKALSGNAEIIYAAPGLYHESISSSRHRDHLTIAASWSSSYTDGDKRAKIVLDMGEDIQVRQDDETDLLISEYTALESSTIYKCFVSKTLDITDKGTRSDGYRITLWGRHGNSIKNDIRLIPVMTLDECKSTAKSWFYDGSSIYINPGEEGIDSYHLSGESAYAINIKNVKNLNLCDIVCDYARDNSCHINYCDNVIMRNCEFNHCSMNNGLSFDCSNGTFYGCSAAQNRNDGFNLHTYGDTHFINCCGYNNYDDGVSHHQGCSGSIIGGEWYNNKKGGIASPTFGAKVNIYNAVCHDNEYGIYSAGNNAVDTDSNVILNGCAIYNNKTGIYNTYYNIIAANCIIKDNQVNISENSNGKVNII